MSGSSIPFGTGPFSAGPWPWYTTVIEVGGAAIISFNVSGDIILTWAQPIAMCEAGTWTLTSLPSGPPNDQLELAA